MTLLRLLLRGIKGISYLWSPSYKAIFIFRFFLWMPKSQTLSPPPIRGLFSIDNPALKTRSKRVSMAIAAPAEKVLAQLIRLLVEYPEQVASATVPTATGQTIQIYVDKADLGSVIGKGGRIARSLRILLSAISVRGGCRLMLDIAVNPSVEPAP